MQKFSIVFEAYSPEYMKKMRWTIISCNLLNFILREGEEEILYLFK
jgi:hypothetical protein